MKRMFLILIMVTLLGTAFTIPEEKAPPQTDGVWYVEKVVYTLMRCNNLYYDLGVEFSEGCVIRHTIWQGHTIWQFTSYHWGCCPYMKIYPNPQNQYATFDAVVTVVYRNIYGGVYYDTEQRLCTYAPVALYNCIQYPN